MGVEREEIGKKWLALKAARAREAREIKHAETIMVGWIAAMPGVAPEDITAMAVPARAAAVALCDACDGMVSDE